MEVTAKCSNLRISPRKVRLVINVVRGLDVEAAETQLQFLSKRASKPVLTLLKSAVANAEHNFKMDKSTLFVKEIRADEAKTYYRYTPRAFGRATPIRKRGSHVSLVLAQKESAQKPQPKAEKPEVKKEEKAPAKSTAKKEAKPVEKKAEKPEPKKEESKNEKQASK